MLISLDIETYGACVTNAKRRPLPVQTVFQPQRSLATDGVSVHDLVLTTSITLLSEDFEPGETMVFRHHRPEDRMRLRRWLEACDGILGMNLQFDIQYLRAIPEFRFALGIGSKQLHDLSVLNYLHSETRPERSLKSLGPVLRLFSYDQEQTLKHERFPHPDDDRLIKYNAMDTHNTALAYRELRRRIARDFGLNTPKLSDFTAEFYSQTLWTVIVMSESGIPMNRTALEVMEKALSTQAMCAHESSRDGPDELPLEGPGSGKAKIEFMQRLHDDLAEVGVDLENKLAITPKRGEISFSEENRNVFFSLLPDGHPSKETLEYAKAHASAQKLISSYTCPLLRHRRNRPLDQQSVVLPTTGLAHPTWYVTPSPIKDGQGASGGTKQGRITCKGPSAQTFPRPIKSTIRSRFGDQGAIVNFDLSQIELRVAGVLSGERSLVDAYNTGSDLHTDRAVSIFGAGDLERNYGPAFRDDPGFKGHERQCGKRTNFADLFRSSAPTMQSAMMEDTGIDFPMSLFQQIVRDRPKVRPELWNWQEQQLGTAERQGYVQLSPTGQSRYFVNFNRRGGGEAKNMLNEIINFPIQTHAGNTLLDIQHRINSRIPDPKSRRPRMFMFLNIYDAVYFDCHLDEVDALGQIIRESVEECATSGYWHNLCSVGSTIPLDYDLEIP
jgi:DNA polymerase I-like protein with 3'-5' exonuclease and polymerase domains